MMVFDVTVNVFHGIYSLIFPISASHSLLLRWILATKWNSFNDRFGFLLTPLRIYDLKSLDEDNDGLR